MEDKTKGMIAIMAASFFWAIEPIFAKLAYANSDFIQASAIRATFSCIIAIFYVTVINKSDLKIKGKYLIKIFYIGIVGTLVGDLLYLFSLTKIPVINAVLIGHIQPVFIIMLGFFLLKEDKLNKYDFTGIFLMIFSAFLVTTGTFQNFLSMKFGTSGDLFVLLATFAWATTAIVGRKYLTGINAGVLTFYRFLIASFPLLIYLALNSKLYLANIYQIFLGFIGGTGTILYYEGLKRIKAAQVSAIELSTPFFSSILSFFILGETLTPLQISGIFLLLAGIYFLSKKEEN
ncbi:MAG: DMT family transporter [Thermoplasmatales archaeon]|nr:DMT family transporter [Thermoplasmatales archaeon]